MRWPAMLGLVAVLGVGCDRPRETVVVMPPEEPAEPQPATTIFIERGSTNGGRGAGAEAQPAPAENQAPTADDRQPTPDSRGPTTESRAPATDNRPPTTDTRLPPTDDRPATPIPSATGYGPAPADVSIPEGSTKNPGEPRADVSARVVLDAGALRYELYASAPKPWVVKSTTPFELQLRPSSGVTLSRTHFNRNDFVNPNALVKQINTDITAAAPGEHVIEADVELYVCSAELCKRMNERLRTAFTNPGS